MGKASVRQLTVLTLDFAFGCKTATFGFRKDASEIACQWYNSVLRDSDGRTIAVLSLVLDITERDKAEAGFARSWTTIPRVPT